MEDKKGLRWILGLLIAVIIVFGPTMYKEIVSPDVEDVKRELKDYLYDKYDEEFIVDRIGTREDDGITEYVARIYPESIIGTKKQGDSYYYGKASIDVGSFGRLEKPGDSYGLNKINIGAEKYLLPKVNNIFGKRVLLKPEVKYKKRQSNGFYAWYKEPSFLKAINELKSKPDKRRIELKLYVYIFDRIDNKTEKEKRRKEIYEFVQYLKDEGLFGHLEMGVVFIDERVLAPSYYDFRSEIYAAESIKKEIDEETVYLPPMELRERMSKKLKKEVAEMSEKELLASMGKIKKSRLTYDGINKYNAINFSNIYSIGILREKYNTFLEKNPDVARKYDKVSDVGIPENLEYIYVD